MRIAIYSDNFYPELSGISDSILLTARELKALGHSVDFYAPAYAKKDYAKTLAKSDEELKKNYKIFRMASLRFPNSPTGQARFVFPLPWRFLTVKKNRPDIIHTQDPFGAGIEALIAARIFKIPLLGTNHTPISEFVKYSPLFGNRITKLAENFFIWYYNHCDFVTCPSNYLVNEMLKNGLKKPHQVLSNPVEVDSFQVVSASEKESLKKELGLAGFVIIYSGRMAPEKNVDKIIKAAKIIKDKNINFNLILTGCGISEKKMRMMVSNLELEKEVKFYGFVAENILAKLYQASDVFAVMSTAESQCLSLMKAFASGIPAIGACARALPEFINSENGITVEVGNSHMLAQKIIELYQNAEKRQEMGQNGRITAEKYSAKNVAKEWEKLYQKVIKEYYNK